VAEVTLPAEVTPPAEFTPLYGALCIK